MKRPRTAGWILMILFGASAQAGPHYIETPGYTHRDTRFSNVTLAFRPESPDGTEIAQKELHLDREVLCRIEYLKGLLCGDFREGHTSPVTLSEHILSRDAFVLLTDIAYWDRIEVSSEPEKRQRDEAAVLELIEKTNIVGGIRSENGILKREVSSESPGSLAEEEPIEGLSPLAPLSPHPEFSLDVEIKILDWVKKEDFNSDASEIGFLVSLYSRLYGGFNRTSYSPEKKRILEIEKSMLAEKIRDVSCVGALNRGEITTIHSCIQKSQIPDRIKNQLYSSLATHFPAAEKMTRKYLHDKGVRISNLKHQIAGVIQKAIEREPGLGYAKVLLSALPQSPDFYLLAKDDSDKIASQIGDLVTISKPQPTAAAAAKKAKPSSDATSETPQEALVLAKHIDAQTEYDQSFFENLKALKEAGYSIEFVFTNSASTLKLSAMIISWGAKPPID